MDISHIKKQFPLWREQSNLVYLDSAASTQTPDRVLEKMDEYYRAYRANIHRGLYGLSARATDAYEGAREKVARFIHGVPEELIFTSGATDAMNRFVAMLEYSHMISEGDEIVASVMDHHAVIVPLFELAKRRGLTLRHIPRGEGVILDYDAAETLITKKTKLVVVSHAGNVSGTVNDVERIVRRAREVGAMVVLDCAKSAGHIPIDVRKFSVDALFFSGHKMYGPTGIGALWVRQDILDTLTPGTFGGGAIDIVSKDAVVFAKVPHCFEPGTPPIAEAIGLAEAVSFIEEVGEEMISAHEDELVAYAIGMLRAVPGAAVYGAEGAGGNAGAVSFTMEGAHPHDISDILGDKGVCVRAGHHCAALFMESLGVSSTVRVSFGVYNTKEDIDTLSAGLHAVREIMDGGR